MPSTYDLTMRCRYSPLRLAMADSAADLTFDSVAGPATLISRVSLPAVGSACSEIIENGWLFERVGAGAVPQPMRVNKTKTLAIARIMIGFIRSINYSGTAIRARQLNTRLRENLKPFLLVSH